MNDYEILLIIDPEALEGRQDEILARTRELIEQGGGSVDGHDVWGRRRLAFEIDHKAEGVYHLLTFSCDPETLAEVSRVLRISDGVMRHMATRRVAVAAGAASSVPAEDSGLPEEYPATEEPEA
ncbi:MAG: 30S ribosomal protein S6 [Candidatus Rokuibacteriota bacterium]|nr:MAG: 30S ribosomal protein S6 [Candidatus Rokubacteria bacterium]